MVTHVFGSWRMMTRDDKPKVVYWLDDKLYLNITNKCSNKCVFCLRNFKQGVGGFTLKLSEEPSFEQITSELEAAMQRQAWREIVFCGFGEPTARLDLMLKLTRGIKTRYGSVSIRVNTNGHGYALNVGREVAEELKAAGVDKVSISLNAGDEETYNEVCQPALPDAFASVLEFIEKAKGVLDVEVSAVTTPEVEICKAEELAKQLGVKFRLRQCIPCFW
jgi:cyclic pyranopterin phosphate synthase